MKETVPGEKEDIHMYRDDDEDETYSGDSESESEGNMSRIQAVYCPFFWRCRWDGLWSRHSTSGYCVDQMVEVEQRRRPDLECEIESKLFEPGAQI